MAVITSTQVAEWLRWKPDKVQASHADLTRIVTAADACVRRVTGRSFTRRDNVTRLFTLPERTRRVPVGDVRSVTLVETRRTPFEDYQTLGQDTWRLGGTRDDWPFQEIVRNDGYLLPEGLDSLRVTGNWGWSTVPASVEQAALMLASNYLARAQSPKGAAVSAVGGADIDYAEMMDRDIMELLADYKTGWEQVV